MSKRPAWLGVFSDQCINENQRWELRCNVPENAAAAIVKWLPHHMRRDYKEYFIVRVVFCVGAGHILQPGQKAENGEPAAGKIFLLCDHAGNDRGLAIIHRN